MGFKKIEGSESGAEKQKSLFSISDFESLTFEPLAAAPISHTLSPEPLYQIHAKRTYVVPHESKAILLDRGGWGKPKEKVCLAEGSMVAVVKRTQEAPTMWRKVAGVMAGVLGAWVGYSYAIDLIATFGMDVSDYWSKQGEVFLRVILTVGAGLVSGVLVYFLLNLFSRFD
jgi:hypothetical protein